MGLQLQGDPVSTHLRQQHADLLHLSDREQRVARRVLEQHVQHYLHKVNKIREGPKQVNAINGRVRGRHFPHSGSVHQIYTWSPAWHESQLQNMGMLYQARYTAFRFDY